jgi:citronellol/citronellal dehydrogenase
MSDLSGRTVFMSGGSRGIGLAIAEKLARDGANIALLAKTDQPHPKLEGTIHTAAEAIEKACGQALPIVADAAYEILKRPPGEQTGQALIDDEVLREAGTDDLSEYAADGADLQLDIFVADWG